MKQMMAEMGIDVALGVVAIAILYLALGSFGFYQPSQQLRAAVGSAWEKNGLSVALVWRQHRDFSFIEGAKLAFEENNAAHNALSQKIRLSMYTESDIFDGTRMAQQVASHRDIVAVLGHELPASAMNASLVYENHGILFLAPTPTNPRLTTHGFQFVFRLTPDDRAIATALVHFSKQQGYAKLAVIYARTSLGESLGPRLISELAKQGMELSVYRSYLPLKDWHQQDFREMIAEVMQKPFDALIVVDELPRAASLVAGLRRMGVQQPILGGDKLDSPELWEIAGQAAEGIYTVSAVDNASQGTDYMAFRQAFRKRYGAEPSYSASQGYDSAHLLIEAVLRSKSADPIVLATTLRVGKWKGIFGPFSFDHEGDVVGRNLFTKRMSAGIFAAVPPGKDVACCRP